MKSYKIYLTKSAEAAARLAASFEGERKAEDIEQVRHGVVGDDDCIPKIYHDNGFFCCVVELKPYGDNDEPTYELTIC